ncbi:MAG: dienelactone hydrolase family protein [Betaproteobacteria bacterium]|nr:dienelactone hydrolase family protein [Betaproteobacteria bacterium]
MGKIIELAASDGHRFSAYRAGPPGKIRGALVVVQEIFGVNSHIRGVTDGYAADGYVCIAPAFYDRAQRNYETGYSQDEIQAGIVVMQKLDWNNTMKDVQATLDALKSSGKVGIVGYCWGGTVAWLAAARVSGLACAIPYYGGGISGFIGEKPKCPVMFQFGEQDQNPNLEQAKNVAAAHPSAIAHFYAAGHGFNCDQRASYDAAASKLARTRALEFLAKHVG